jgi:hypothetical protein
MLRVNILRDIILSVVMLNVIAPSVFSLGSKDSLTDSRSLVEKTENDLAYS